MPDFEPLEEPEWTQVVSTKKPETRKPYLLVPQFDFERDNDATAAWRRGSDGLERLPRSVGMISRKWFELPGDFDPQAQVPDQSLTKGKWSPTPLIPELEEIMVETSTHLDYVPKKGRQPPGVEIWCRGDQLLEVRKRLNTWVKAQDPAFFKPKPSRWAKVYVVNPMTRAERAKELHENEIRQAFRRQPDPDYVPNGIGYFEWPVDAVKISDVLGKSLEALDPIRMDHHCYINWVPEDSSLRIMGKKQESVERATDRVRATFFQVVARQSDPKPNYFVRPLSAAGALQNCTIQLDKVKISENNGAPKAFPRIEFHKSSQMHMDLDNKEAIANPTHFSLQKAVSQALQRLPYYSGNVTMRARLGQFELIRYPAAETKYSLEDFESFLGTDKAKGLVSQENGDRMRWHRQKKLFRTIAKSPTILEPVLDTRTYWSGEPPKVPKRSVNAIFIVQLYREPGFFRVEVHFDRSPGSQLERVSTTISKVEDKCGELARVSDIALLDLERRTSAWSFEINAGYTVDITKFPQLDRWALENIHGKNDSHVPPNDAKDEFAAEHRYISYTASKGITVHSVQQQSVELYAIPNTSYLCEISLNEEFANQSSNFQNPAPQDFKPTRRWISLSAYNESWDVKLAENAGLNVGERVKWNPSLGDFFPLPAGSASSSGESHPGFGKFISALYDVQDLMYPIRGSGDN